MAQRRYQRGFVFLRGKREKVWVGRWREDVETPDGTKQRVLRSEVLGTLKDIPSKRLALRALDEKVAVVNALNYKPTMFCMLNVLATRWQQAIVPQLKKGSQKTLPSLLKHHVLPYLGEMPLHQITTEALQQWLAMLTIAPKTKRTCVGVLRMVWASGKAWGYVKHNPFDGLRMPPNVGVLKNRRFTADEIRRIIEAAGEPYKTIYALLAETGARIGEVMALKLEALHLDERYLRIERRVYMGEVNVPKSKRGIRSCALSPALVAHLRRYLALHWKRNEEGWLFGSANGKPLDYNWIGVSKFHPLLKSLGIDCPEGKAFHAFRHGNATILDQLNAPMATRQDRLGHATAEMTMHYTEGVTEADLRTAEELGKLLLPDGTHLLEAPPAAA